MNFPCEITLWYILPKVRSQLAKELVMMGMTQKEVSEKLGITQASVSHYIRKRRGDRIRFRKNITNEIKKLARNIKKGEDISKINSQICEICKLAREDKTLCQSHF